MRLFFASLIVVIAVNVSTEAQIKVLNDSFNFGKTTQHAKMIHKFWLRATGDEPVRITRVIPGCGCTKMPLPDSVIAPGDSLPLTIIFDTKTFRGNIVKRPYFMTDADDERRFLKIYAEALIHPEDAMPVVIQPTKVDVSQFGELPRRRASFNIVNKSDQDLKIRSVGVGYESFDLDLPGKVKAGETVTAKIVVHEDRMETEFEESITIELDDDLLSRYTISVRRLYRTKTDAEISGGN